MGDRSHLFLSIKFLIDILNNHYYWLEGKKIIFYHYAQQDLTNLFLFVIMVYTIKRWNRIKDR